MIQFREKSGRKVGQMEGQMDDTEFIRPHYRGSKKKNTTTKIQQTNLRLACCPGNQITICGNKL